VIGGELRLGVLLPYPIPAVGAVNGRVAGCTIQATLLA